MKIYNVNEATLVLQEKGLVKDIEGTRRYIRKGELIATKLSNHLGYKIEGTHLDLFIWVKQHQTNEIIERLIQLEKVHK